MNHTEITRLVAARSGRDVKDVDRVLKDLRDVCVDVLDAGQKVTLLGVGILTPIHKPARQGRNPRSGEPIHVQSRNAVRFRASKSLTDRLNGRGD